MSEPLPELRASDSDRERTVEVLRHGASDGQLTVDELEERVSAAYAARTRRELEQLTADVTPATVNRQSTVTDSFGSRSWAAALCGAAAS